MTGEQAARLIDQMQRIEELLLEIRRTLDRIAGEPAPGERGLGH